MWRTIDAAPGMTAQSMVGEILRANQIALDAQHSQLINIVINCHGMEGGGKLLIGGKGSPGIDIKTVGEFASLKNRNIGTIWLVACQAAAGVSGKMLCQVLATISGCQVVAADTDQDVGVWGGYRIIAGSAGIIDEFEGTVYSFTPKGLWNVIDPHTDVFTTLE
jgi:hypothetical protein